MRIFNHVFDEDNSISAETLRFIKILCTRSVITRSVSSCTPEQSFGNVFNNYCRERINPKILIPAHVDHETTSLSSMYCLKNGFTQVSYITSTLGSRFSKRDAPKQKITFSFYSSVPTVVFKKKQKCPTVQYP